MPRKPKQKPETGLPSREALLEFIAGRPDKAGKREIARAFGIAGADRIGLKRLLREMEDEGLIAGKREHLRRPGDLPSVTVLLVEGIDDAGEPIGVPVEWDEEWGAPPRVVIGGAPKGRGRSEAPGLGDRVLARLTPEPETGGFTGKVIKLLERRPKATLGIFRQLDGEARIGPIDRRGPEREDEERQQLECHVEHGRQVQLDRSIALSTFASARHDGLTLRLGLVHRLEREVAKSVVLARLDHAIQQVKRRGPVRANHDRGGQLVAGLQ